MALNICGNLSGSLAQLLLGLVFQRTQKLPVCHVVYRRRRRTGLISLHIPRVGKIEVILPEKKNADTVDKNAINPATANK